MQYDDLCFDFTVSPSRPGGVLVGEVRARTLGDGGSCGLVVTEHRSVALTPTGPAGQAGGVCQYRVTNTVECSPGKVPIFAGATLCLPCVGACEEFPQGVSFVYRNPNPSQSAYIDCVDVPVDLVGEQCDYDQGCTDDLPAITILRRPSSSAFVATTLAAHGVGATHGTKP